MFSKIEVRLPPAGAMGVVDALDGLEGEADAVDLGALAGPDEFDAVVIALGHGGGYSFLGGGGGGGGGGGVMPLGGNLGALTMFGYSFFGGGGGGGAFLRFVGLGVIAAISKRTTPSTRFGGGGGGGGGFFRPFGLGRGSMTMVHSSIPWMNSTISTSRTETRISTTALSPPSALSSSHFPSIMRM